VSLTAKDVSEILKLLEESSFDELNLEMGDFKLRLRRNGAGGLEDAMPAADTPRTVAATPAPAPEPAPTKAKAAKAKAAEEGLVEVPAPLLGIYYRAPKPGEPPFVEVGQQVEEDTVVGIIEVMKLMNSVRAGVRGEIVEIAAQNGALVEYGEALMRVRPA
jgi:acetyl-CoA carboxylase biotin carboxyl carrier protein